MASEFGKRVRALRKSHNLTLNAVAEKIGTSKAYLWQIENRDSPNPSASVVLGLAKVFSVSPYFLFNNSTSDTTDEIVDYSLLEKINNLSGRDKEIVSAMINSLYSSGNQMANSG